MISAKTNSFVDPKIVLDSVDKSTMDPMDKAAITVKQEIQGLIKRPNPDGKNPSAPGDPPKKRRGILMSSISWARDGEKRLIGARRGTPYAKWLEEGTTNMKARPFLVVGRDKALKRSSVKKLFAGKLRGSRGAGIQE